jgi:hypothetical protein
MSEAFVADTPTGFIFGLDKELRRYLRRLNRLGSHNVAGLVAARFGRLVACVRAQPKGVSR